MRFEIRPFKELFESGEFQAMFFQAFGYSYDKDPFAPSDAPPPDKIGLLFDGTVKVSFLTFRCEDDIVLLIDLGHLKTAPENRQFVYFFRIVEEFRNMGFASVVAEVPVTGIASIINCLSVGFQIAGCRQVGEKLFVQLVNHMKSPIESKAIKMDSGMSGQIH